MKKPYLLIITAILCLALTGSMSQANDPDIETLKQAVEANPDDADAYYNLGAAYGKLNMHEEAIEAYIQAIRIDPDNAEAHYNLGMLYNLSNDRSSAIKQYKILEKLDSEIANLLFNLIYKTTPP